MKRRGILTFLDNPLLWEFSRIVLDLTIGLYRKRLRVIVDWEIITDTTSILDIGCGIGQYASITKGNYLGIDLNERYIGYARRRHQRPNQLFQCKDVTDLISTESAFDLVLMVDILHHISDKQCIYLLTTAAHLAKQYIVIFEPVTFQSNPLGRWVIDHDRGEYIRSLEKLHGLVEESPLTIAQSIQLRIGPINGRAILCHPRTIESCDAMKSWYVK